MIREARDSDIEVIARVLVTSWQHAFRGIVADDYLGSMDVVHQARRHARTFIKKKVKYWVLEDGSEIRGFISGGLARFDIGSADCELYAIYMLPQYQGKGFGRQLVAKLEAYCVDMGWRCMGVLVLADNPNLAFYKSLGFKIVEKTLIELGERKYPEFKMVLALTAQQGGAPGADKRSR